MAAPGAFWWPALGRVRLIQPCASVRERIMCKQAIYTAMILTFRHKGLEVFFNTGNAAGIQPIHTKRLRELLTALNVAQGPQDLARPSWRLHGLSGDRAGFHAVTVQANWRLVFRFVPQGVELLDYIDYH